MAGIDFSNLMDEEVEETSQSIDFKGLMNSPSTSRIPEKQEESYTQKVLDAPEKVSELIGQRGTLWEQYTADTSGIGIGKTFLRNISLPAAGVSSTPACLAISPNSPRFNPSNPLAESASKSIGL